MGDRDIESAKKSMSSVLKDKFQSDGGSLEKQLRKAKGKLPASARRDADVILQSEKDLAHPVLRKRVNKHAVKTAKRRFMKSTQNIDLARDRVRSRYGLATDIVLKLIICAALLYLVIAYLA